MRPIASPIATAVSDTDKPTISDTRAVDNAAVDVAAELVGAEPGQGRGRAKPEARLEEGGVDRADRAEHAWFAPDGVACPSGGESRLAASAAKKCEAERRHPRDENA